MLRWTRFFTEEIFNHHLNGKSLVSLGSLGDNLSGLFLCEQYEQNAFYVLKLPFDKASDRIMKREMKALSKLRGM